MHQDIEKVLLTSEEIAAITARLGRRVTADYRGKDLLVIGVLNGAVFFAADLLRAIDLPCQVDFVGISSYRDGASSGELRTTRALPTSVAGKDVLVVEDVLDTGKTLSYLLDCLRQQGAASVRLCVLLDKESCRQVPVTADYVGAPAGNEFLVGYGLDYAQRYRNLPYIGVLKPEIYQKKSCAQ